MSGLTERHISETVHPGPIRHPGRIDGSAPEPEPERDGAVVVHSIAIIHVPLRRRLVGRGDGDASPILEHDDIMWRTGVRWDAEGYG